MKNKMLGLFAIVILLSISSCEKCYKCNNWCRVCYDNTHVDTVLTIQVCSDILGETYFNEYIDSLTSPGLGWVCSDTSVSKTEKFCGTKTNNTIELLNRKDAGWRCAPE
ncbi:MAG: hypothetical protein KA841_05500 [Chitinophagales bacterium]|jgi:hypothetical protein|nr:hypothetical protein [Chitinophagales bacterium]